MARVSSRRKHLRKLPSKYSGGSKLLNGSLETENKYLAAVQCPMRQSCKREVLIEGT